MAKKLLSRREFIKLGGLSLASLAMQPFDKLVASPPLPPDALGQVRVAAKEVEILTDPDLESDVAGTCHRDELLNIYEMITSPHGPQHNPRWYRIDGGYIHTAHLQPVESHLNEISYTIPEGEQRLAEVSVPITLSFTHDNLYGWRPLYRLYYQSTHWITGVGYGPNGQAFYTIRDHLLGIDYHVAAPHMRFIEEDELIPLSPDVPPQLKRVEVNRTEQVVTAYENNEVVFHTRVSTGLPYNSPNNNGISTITPLGKFYVDIKMPVQHMGNGNITSDVFAYELPGVPWVSYFFKTGVAFHGTFWHDNYGTEMSHGCVNMRPEEAKWLYRWVMPEASIKDRVVGGLGTTVEVVV